MADQVGEGVQIASPGTREPAIPRVGAGIGDRAYIHVLSHPFYSVTGDEGTFELKGLPPGKYEIEAVHEQYGAMTQQVTVEAKKPASVDFAFKAQQAYRPGSLKMMPAIVLSCCGGK